MRDIVYHWIYHLVNMQCTLSSHRQLVFNWIHVSTINLANVSVLFIIIIIRFEIYLCLHLYSIIIINWFHAFITSQPFEMDWIAAKALHLVVSSQQTVNLSLLIKNMYVFVSFMFSQFPSAKLIEINPLKVNLTRMRWNIDTLCRLRVCFVNIISFERCLLPENEMKSVWSRLFEISNTSNYSKHIVWLRCSNSHYFVPKTIIFAYVS